MIRNRIISIFLLCLLLLVNWHNSLFHSHEGLEGRQYVRVHLHEHDYAQTDHHHHRPDSGLLNWLNQLFGDFEHSELGEDHFEVFLQPQQQSGFHQAANHLPVEFAVLPYTVQLKERHPPEQQKIPDRLQSFSDPPFLDLVSNRGPPSFS